MKNSTTIYIVLTVLIPLVTYSCGEKKTVEVKPDDTLVEQKTDSVPPVVRAPFREISMASQEITVDVDSGRIVEANNGFGTRLSIPPAAFVDSAGQSISGTITLEYREFHTLNDILIAGIPLNYDAAGMLKRFNTAGMFEIRAYQGAAPVYLDSGKVIEVNMASFEGGNRYHAFFLDEKTTRNWHYIKDLEGVDNPEKKKLLRKARANVKEFDIPFNGNYFAFNYMALLDVYLNDKTVEIKKMRNDLTLQGKIKEYGVTWTNMFCFQTVEFGGSKYLASLLLWQKLNTEPWPVWASTALCNIEQGNNGNYNLTLSQAKGKGLYKAVIKPFFPIKSLLSFSPSYWKNKYQMALRKAVEVEMRKQKIADVYRSIEVHHFGIYNVEKLQGEEDYLQIAMEAEVNGLDAAALQQGEIYFISERYRTVLRYPYAEWGNITLLPDSEATLFILLPGGKIAIAAREDMRQLDFVSLRKNVGTRVKMVFKTTNSPLKTAADVAAVLGILATPV